MARRNNPSGPVFSQRHYVRIAAILRGARPEETCKEYGENEHDQWERTCLAFLNSFKDDNPKFNRETFLKACKGDE